MLAAAIFSVLMQTVHAEDTVSRGGGAVGGDGRGHGGLGGGGYSDGSYSSSSIEDCKGFLCWIIPIVAFGGFAILACLGMAFESLLNLRRLRDFEKIQQAGPDFVDGNGDLRRELSKVLKTRPLSAITWPPPSGSAPVDLTTLEWSNSYIEDGALKHSCTELKLVAIDAADRTKGCVCGTSCDADGPRSLSGRYNLRTCRLAWLETSATSRTQVFVGLSDQSSMQGLYVSDTGRAGPLSGPLTALTLEGTLT